MKDAHDASETAIAKFLMPFTSEIQELAQALRVFLQKETRPTMELVGDSTLSVNIGYGFSEKAWDCFCAIIVYSKHINISFPSGAGLRDPQGVLVGSGKRIRHIRVASVADLRTPYIMHLLKQARDLALEDAPDGTEGPRCVRTLIKTVGGVKKRPG